MTKQFTTLDGIKRAATKLKRRTGMKHSDALNQIAREAGYADFYAATNALADSIEPPRYAITICESWHDHATDQRGNESRAFFLNKPLSELAKPHQLTGYLGGVRLSGENKIIGSGDSDGRSRARAAICRIARTLQFMSATGLKPSRSRRCYPKGDWNNRPLGADHDQGWYHPETRDFLLTEEPYPGQHQSYADARKAWSSKHGWRTVRSHWGSIYGHGTEFYLTAKAGDGINLAAMARRLAALPPAFTEADWPGDAPAWVCERARSLGRAATTGGKLPSVEIIEMRPELAIALKHQRDLDIAAASPQASEPTAIHRGITITSRWSIASELDTMRSIVDAMPDLVRAGIGSIWCDSNAQAYYCVMIVPGRWYDGIEFEICDAVRAATSGFNGLTVEGDSRNIAFDPEWEGDDYHDGDGAAGGPVEWTADDL